MKNILKPLLISLFILIGLFLLLIGFVWFSRDYMKQYALKQLNEQLTAPVSISSADITFFDQFPRVSLLLHNVVIADPLRKKQNLLQVHQLFIAFNLNDIISREYKIKLIEADSGYCNLFVNEKGQANYVILKETQQDSSDLFLKLNKIRLTGINITYENLQARQYHDIQATALTLSGDFKGKKETLNAHGTVTVNRLKTGSVTFIKNKNIILGIDLKMDEAQSTFTLTKGNIELGSLKLSCEGSVTSRKKATALDLRFQAKKIAVTDLLELFPGNWSNAFKEYKSGGNIYFNGIIKGTLSSGTQPLISVHFGVDNGTLTASRQAVAISNLQCKGEFSNGNKHSLQSSSLIIPTLHFQLGKGAFNGALSITDFMNPFIDFKLDGNTALQDLVNFTGSRWIRSADGNLSFNISLQGKLKELRNKQGFLQSETNGHITFNANNIVLKEGDQKIAYMRADLSLSRHDLVIHSFATGINRSDINISGTLRNFIPFILSDKQTLTADIRYRSDYIDLQHLVLPLGGKNQNSNTFALPQYIIVNAEIAVDELTFHEFKAKKIRGDIKWKDKKIETKQLQCETMNGSFRLNGQVENAPDGRFLLSTTIDCSQINIQELFRQCNHFGQQAITGKHLGGLLNGKIELISVWNEKLDCDLDKLYASGDIHIVNGRLINYEPLEGLSDYVKVEDLRNLKFADLRNKIEIKNRTVYIPSMYVQNNALNINIAGTHTFENFLDYRLQIRLHELLAKKRKTSGANEFGEEDESGKGMYLYLTMKGPADNLKFSYDKVSVKKKVEQDLKKEKETIKQVLQKELGLEKDNTIKEKKTDNDELEFEPE